LKAAGFAQLKAFWRR